MYFTLLAIAWLLAVFWVVRASEVALNLDSVPDIASEPLLSEAMREALPTLAVIVPAKNEGENIRNTLASLVASDYPRLSVIAVDDRSSDATGEIMESLASQDARVGVIHVRELPDGWMGKPHAMHLGATHAKADWLLFTDGDVLFAPDLLSRAVAHAGKVGADHFVIVPTLVMKTVGERSMIGFMQVLAGLGSRLWRVADPKAKRDIVGIGAFNMIRRNVYEHLGGFEATPMEVIEDLRLAKRVKQAGFAQRVAIAPGMVQLHWAPGGVGLARNLTKNLFAALAFRWWVATLACTWLLLVYPGAFAGLIAGAFGAYLLLIPCALIVLSMFAIARKYRRINGISPLYVVTYPIAAVALTAALVGSVVLTWSRGGVLWRGTLYPLRELRKRGSSLF